MVEWACYALFLGLFVSFLHSICMKYGIRSNDFSCSGPKERLYNQVRYYGSWCFRLYAADAFCEQRRVNLSLLFLLRQVTGRFALWLLFI